MALRLSRPKLPRRAGPAAAAAAPCPVDGLAVGGHPHCEHCEILIGPGHVEGQAYRVPVPRLVKREAAGWRPYTLCGGCYHDYGRALARFLEPDTA